MKEKIINYIETLEAKAYQSDYYFKQRNDLYIENQNKDKEIERLNNIINKLEKKITKAIKLLNKYRNRKDTWGLWCMDYGDNAEVIKILGGKVKKD